MRHVGNDHSRRRLACVPVDPDRAEGLAEGVVFGEDGADHDEEGDGEEACKGQLFSEGERGAEEEGKGDGDDQEVRGDVEGEVCDQMVGGCVTLVCDVGLEIWAGERGDGN